LAKIVQIGKDAVYPSFEKSLRTKEVRFRDSPSSGAQSEFSAHLITLTPNLNRIIIPAGIILPRIITKKNQRHSIRKAQRHEGL